MNLTVEIVNLVTTEYSAILAIRKPTSEGRSVKSFRTTFGGFE